MHKVQPFALVSAAVIAIGLNAKAAPIPLTEGNSTFVVDPMSQAGASFWSIGGNNQLNQQFFWYNVGGGLQHSIEYGATTITPTTIGTDKLSVKYNYGGLFTIDVHYNLNSIGGNAAQLEQSVGITNLTAGTLSLNFFQYNNFDLAGSAGFDDVLIENSGASQNEGVFAITEAGIDPLALYFEGNTTGGTSSTLYRLNNTPDLNLNNTGAASGDVTWAFQWQFDLSGLNNGVEILKGQNLAITLIPEPTSLSLALATLAVARLLKRSHRSKN
jgi:hypothetical protein